MSYKQETMFMAMCQEAQSLYLTKSEGLNSQYREAKWLAKFLGSQLELSDQLA